MNGLLLRDPSGHVIGLRRDDGACIPLEDGNADFQRFLAWHGPLPDGDPDDWRQEADGRLRAMTAEEKTTRDAERAARIADERWAAVRAERNRRLVIVDHGRSLADDRAELGVISAEQLANARAEFALLRQRLRDVPQDNSDPWAVAWPRPAESLTPYLAAADLAVLGDAF